MPKLQLLRFHGDSARVITAVQRVRSSSVAPHYVRASATDPTVEWIAEVKVPLDLVSQLKTEGWSAPSQKGQEVQDKPKTKSENRTTQSKTKTKSKSRSGLNGVRGPEHWKRIDELRLARAANGSKAAVTSEFGEIRVILFSKRGTYLNRLSQCDNCGKTRSPVWAFRESTEGRVSLCEWCKKHVYERSHGTSPNDAMYKAVYRRRARG